MAKDAKELAQEILKDSLIGTMATIEQNKPHSRYMTFFNNDFILYTATSKKTHKVEELQKNPNTHILLGYDGKGLGDAFLEIEGTVEEHDDESMKKNVWNKALEGWFKGPEDPNLIILKITPTQIRVMNTKGEEPQIVEF
ncbi:pyridoxamine 5'-phosphate oxidase family protein [Psychrobacillus lasiicapitis]|uniref:General stress protein n=1 Tax=Psychrobacillus lasiicapitis TaxID=1636719 RepID=A0A544SX25_9BACI|nr:pyridoxamine 5'-phosphate oxidase family protein [Psychrobacillus lasiicapitis]TQR09764.1 general stress protein [Psychrobacillus lasiicapitis]GGA23312.1 general stress protein 26 [Psychrobacillus lasiicapitis]